MDRIDEHLLKKAWDLLDMTWRRLDEKRSHPIDEEGERFVSSWQVRSSPTLCLVQC
jgi:hypothetical protein